jgi:hypothetical protein
MTTKYEVCLQNLSLPSPERHALTFCVLCHQNPSPFSNVLFRTKGVIIDDDDGDDTPSHWVWDLHFQQPVPTRELLLLPVLLSIFCCHHLLFGNPKSIALYCYSNHHNLYPLLNLRKCCISNYTTSLFRTTI